MLPRGLTAMHEVLTMEREPAWDGMHSPVCSYHTGGCTVRLWGPRVSPNLLSLSFPTTHSTMMPTWWETRIKEN